MRSEPDGDRPEKTASTGIVAWHDGRIKRIVEKPQPEEAPSNISSLPLYVFSSKLLPHLANVQASPRGEYELQDAMQMLIDNDGGVTGVLTPSRRQLTNVDDLLALNSHFLAAEAQRADTQRWRRSALVQRLRRRCTSGRRVIGRDCVIGPDVSSNQAAASATASILRTPLCCATLKSPRIARLFTKSLLDRSKVPGTARMVLVERNSCRVVPGTCFSQENRYDIAHPIR